MFRAIMYYISYCREVYVSAAVQNGIMSRACVCVYFLSSLQTAGRNNNDVICCQSYDIH